MNLQVNEFPVKSKDMELKAPYTITKALHYAESHYVGYTLKDTNNNCVDILNIVDLREYMKICPTEFTNARIGKYGHIEIDNFLNLEHKDCLNYHCFEDKVDINDGLLGILNIQGCNIKPSNFYSYELEFITKEYICSLTDEAVKYLNLFKNLDINSFPKDIAQLIRSEENLQIPSPLCKIGDIPVSSCKGLFSNLDMFNGKNNKGFDSRIVPDFSLVDLSYYNNIDSLFESSSFYALDVKSFNLKPKGKVESLFSSLVCDSVDLTDLDFSEITSLILPFDSCYIKEVKAKGIDISSLSFKDNRMFNNSFIQDFDVSLYETINERYLVDEKYSGTLFSNLICKNMVNLDCLPTKNATYLPKLFAGLGIDELNITDLNLDKLENFDKLLSKVHCNKFVYNAKVFEQSKTARFLFKDTILKSGLNLKKIAFKNLNIDGAIGMFEGLEVDGELILPINYGNAQNFDRFVKGIKARKIQMKHSDFSKATRMCSFLEDGQVYQAISMPQKEKLVPKNLESASRMFALDMATSLHIRGWSFENVKRDYSSMTMKNGKIGFNILDADFDSSFVKYLISNSQYKKLFRAVKNQSFVEFYKSQLSVKPRINWTIPLEVNFKYVTVTELDLDGCKSV